MTLIPLGSLTKSERSPASIQTALVLALVDGEEHRVRRATATEIEVETADELPDDLPLTLTVFDVHAWQYVDFEFPTAKVSERSRLEYSHVSRILLGPLADDEQRAQLSDALAELETLWGAAPRRPGPQGTAPLKDRSQALPHYPPKTTRSYQTYDEQRRAWFAPVVDAAAVERFSSLAERVEHAFNACTPQSYDSITEHGPTEGIRLLLEQIDLVEHPLFGRGFTRIYLGNEFCPHLFPKLGRLTEMLDRAHAESLSITVNGPYLIEHTVDWTIDFLKHLQAWAERSSAPLELVVNDWGMLGLLSEHAPDLTPVLGRLLNRRKKDSRVKWYWGHQRHERHLGENNLNAPWYRDFLSERGLERYEFEAGPMRASLPSRGHALHYPFYQTNSSVFCMLYAEVTEFYMGRQRMVQSCPRYCTDFCYLYPDHLKLVGKGNTIFGFDDEILSKPDSLINYVEQGVDRLVFSADC